MRRRVRALLTLLAICLVSVPLGAVATILLLPFWSWFEATTGIESVGHSGPAGWCYFAVFVIFVAVAAVVSMRCFLHDPR